jgi:phage-related holin
VEGTIEVFIYDPRLFRKFLERARSLRINVRVPMGLDDIKAEGVLIVDKEGLRIVENRIRHGVKVEVIDEKNLDKKLLEVLGLKKVSTLIVGVDIGRKIAYAVFADYILVGTGYVNNAIELLNKLTELREALTPFKAIVRIGMPGPDHLYNTLSNILELLAKSDFETYLVDEEKSTSRPLQSIKGLSKKFPMDINAAINIALRSGFKVIS